MENHQDLMGLTVHYYKTLLPHILPHFIKALNSLRHDLKFSRDSLLAHITVVPKEGKDPMSYASYRPIPLLNLDLKLFFTKILANLIYLDQVSFLPNREAKDYIIKTLNLIHVTSTIKTPCFFLATDAGKAIHTLCTAVNLSGPQLPQVDMSHLFYSLRSGQG